MRLATVVSTDRFDAIAEKLLTADERAALEFSLAKGPDDTRLERHFYAISAQVILLLAGLRKK